MHALPVPVRPRGARNHPNLHRNPHVNEHLTYCAMHFNRSNDARAGRGAREAHRRAAAAHLAETLHHMRQFPGAPTRSRVARSRAPRSRAARSRAPRSRAARSRANSTRAR